MSIFLSNRVITHFSVLTQLELEENVISGSLNQWVQHDVLYLLVVTARVNIHSHRLTPPSCLFVHAGASSGSPELLSQIPRIKWHRISWSDPWQVHAKSVVTQLHHLIPSRHQHAASSSSTEQSTNNTLYASTSPPRIAAPLLLLSPVPRARPLLWYQVPFDLPSVKSCRLSQCLWPIHLTVLGARATALK